MVSIGPKIQPTNKKADYGGPVVRTCNANTLKVEAGGSELEG